MLSQQNAAPTSNQPQTVTASQPTSKAVQSSGVAAGVGVQPPRVELDSVDTTTATEVVSNPGAVLPITWLLQHLSHMLLYHCLPFATLCVCVSLRYEYVASVSELLQHGHCSHPMCV